MPNNDLAIYIKTLIEKTSIDTVKSSVDTLVTSLQQKLDKLNIKVNINTSQFDSLTSSIKQVQNQAEALNNVISKTTNNVSKETKFYNAGDLNNATKVVTTYNEALGRTRTEVQKAGELTNVIINQNNETIKKAIISVETLQEKYKGVINTLKTGKLGSFVDVSALEKFKIQLGSIKEVNSKVRTELLNTFNQIKNNAQLASESAKLEAKAFDANNAEILRGMKLREQEQQKLLLNQEKINKQLNTKMQNALNLGVKFNNLSPEQLAPLEKALNRYKTLLSDMKQKNLSGQLVSDKDIERLQRLENAIKRVYDNTRIASKDSRGFNFEQYPKMQNAVQGATNAQNYYNQSIIHGKKLLEANIQETEKYIKVTQRLREGSKITSVTAYVNKLTGETHKFSQSIRDLMTRTWDLGSSFKTALEKISLWAGATGIFYSVANSIQQIGREIIDVDTKLTELSKVLENDTNWSKLMRDTAESANMMAKSITQALDAEIEFAKQGYNAEQSVALARTSMLGSNVTGLETGQMASYLTGILAQFNVEAEKSSTIIDKLNEVDNNFAITSIGLAQSINKAGESAQQFGITLDELIGFTTSIGTATRESGNQIGNMLKFSFARINTDKAQEALASMNIAVKDITGELLPLGQIYGEVANKWDSMTRAEKTYIAESLAGKHHITRLMALFDNWGISLDATTTAQTSLGSAIEENYKHLHSLESQLNRNKAAFQELAYTMGESGVKKAMSSVLSVTSQYINGLTEMTKFNGLLVNSIAILGGVILLKLLPAIKTEYKDWIVRNGLVSTAIPLNHRLIISYTMLSTIIKSATVSLIAFSRALLLNPLTWVFTALTAIPMMLGHMKQVREEQEQLNKTYEETKQKLDDIIERSNKIGSPLLQDVNNIDATIKKLDELKGKIEEIDQEHRSGTFGFQSLMVKDLSKELKDLAAQMGINITQYQTTDEVLKAINEEQNILAETLNTAKDNSTEYQKTLIDQANNQTKVADNNVKLIDTYTELSNKSNLTAEEQRKLNDITAILTQSYPHLIDAKGDTITISNKVIEAMKKEAKEQKELADENESATKQQLINNKIKLQDQVKTSLGVMKSLSGEIIALQALNNAKIDPKYLLEAQAQNTLDRMQGKDTPYSSDVDMLLSEIRSPNSTKLYALNNKYKEEKRKLKETYDNIAKIDDSLNSSLPDLTQSTKESTEELDKNKEILNELTDATKQYKNAVDALNNTLNKLRNDREKMIIGSKEYLKSLEEENEKIREREKLLKNQIANQPTYTTSGASSNSYKSTSNYDDYLTGKTNANPMILERLASLAKDYNTKINITSGYRTYDEQVILKNKYGDGAASPGSSPHHTGQAVDISGGIKDLIANGKITNEILSKYGLTRRLDGTGGIHGDKNEPWHIETQEYQNIVSGKISREDFYKQYGGGNNFDTSQWKSTPNVNNITINGVSSEVRFADIINQAVANNVNAQKLGITPALIAGMIDVETGGQFNADAYNNKSGASGLGQFLSSTWKEEGNGGDVFNAEDNINAIVKYLEKRVNWAGGNLKEGIKGYGEGTEEYYNLVNQRTQKYGLSPVTVSTTASTEAMRDAQDKQDALTNDMIAESQKLAEQREQNSLQWWEAHWTLYDSEIVDIQNERNNTQAKSELLSPLSDDYRNNLQSQVDSMKEQQDKLHEAAEKRREALQSEIYINNPAAAKKLQEQIDGYSLSWLNLEKDINNTSFDKVNSQLQSYDNQLTNVDNTLKQSENTLSQYPQYSQQYRDELSKQSTLLKQKEELIKSEIAFTKSQLTNTDLLPPAIQELNTKLLEYNNILQEIQKTEKDKLFEVITSKIAEFDNNITQLNNSLAVAEDNIGLYTKGTSDYNKYLSQSVGINKQIIQVLQNKIKYIDQEIAKTADLIEKQNLIQQKYDALSNMYSIQNSIQSQLEQQAEDIIQIYKDVYEKQKDLALDAEEERHDTVIENLDSESEKYEDNINAQNDAIEKQTELLDKQHDKMTSALDDELSQYDEIIDAKLKLLDTQNDEQDYQSQLTDLQKEKKDIENSMLILRSDNSPEAKARLDDLNKELITKNKEINDLKLSHTRELAKNELNAQKDAYKKQIDAKKKSVTDSYNLDKANLENSKQAYSDDLESFKSFMQMKKDAEDEYYDKQKETITDYYDNLINDERRWAKLRKEIIAGNLSEVQRDFNSFGVYFNNHLEELGQVITNNFTDKFKEAIQEIKNLQTEASNLDLSNATLPSTPNTDTSIGNPLDDWAGSEESFWELYDKYKAESNGNGFYIYSDNDPNTLFYFDKNGKYIGHNRTNSDTNIGNDDTTNDNSDDNHNSFYKYKSLINSVIAQKKKWQDANEDNDEEGKENAKNAATSYYNQLRNSGTVGQQVASILENSNYDQAIKWRDANVYHEGNSVLSQGKTPNKIQDLINKIFNKGLKSDEVPAILQSGEVVLSKYAVQNFIPSVRNFANSLVPNTTPTVVTNGGHTYNLNIKIDSMNGSKSDINNFATKIINGVKKLGS